jgi:hypothetical protein
MNVFDVIALDPSGEPIEERHSFSLKGEETV